MSNNEKMRMIREKLCDGNNIVFAEKMGVSPEYASNICRFKTVGGRVLNRVAQAFPEVNKSWLFYGEGEMLVNQVTEDVVPIDGNIRYWMDVDATGGGVELFGDTMTERTMVISLPGFGDCTDAVNLFGDSMSPRYKSGEIIILRPWREPFIDFGQIYLIVTDTGYRMVKYLQPGCDEGHVLCVSENVAYKPFEIEKANIVKMWLVKGSISRNTI